MESLRVIRQWISQIRKFGKKQNQKKNLLPFLCQVITGNQASKLWSWYTVLSSMSWITILGKSDEFILELFFTLWSNIWEVHGTRQNVGSDFLKWCIGAGWRYRVVAATAASFQSLVSHYCQRGDWVMPGYKMMCKCAQISEITRILWKWYPSLRHCLGMFTCPKVTHQWPTKCIHHTTWWHTDTASF